MAKKENSSKVLYFYLPKAFIPEYNEFSKLCENITKILKKNDRLSPYNLPNSPKNSQSFIMRYLIYKFNVTNGGKLNIDNYSKDREGNELTEEQKKRAIEQEIKEFMLSGINNNDKEEENISNEEESSEE